MTGSGDDELREAIDQVVAEWLKTQFAIGRASWAYESGRAAIDHMQHLHLSQHEAQLTPKILSLFDEHCRRP